MNADRFGDQSKKEHYDSMLELIEQSEFEMMNFQQTNNQKYLENYLQKLQIIKSNAQFTEYSNLTKATKLIETVCKNPQSKYFFDKNFKYIDYVIAVLNKSLTLQQKDAYFLEFLRQITRSDS